MRPVVRFTLAQTVLFNLVFVALIVAGAFSVMRVPVERYPQVNFGKVIVSCFWPGASAQDMEALVTRKIEDALQDLEQVEFIQSSSSQQFSVLVVKFNDDTDYQALYDELRFRVLSMIDELPDDADPPGFTLVRTSEWLPVVAVNLVGPSGNRALALMAEELKVPLADIPGVQEVEIEGEYQREFHVLLDPARMAALGVGFDQVARALEAANVSLPAGDYTDESGEFMVRVDERFRTRDQVAATVVRRDKDGSMLTVADLMSDARLDYRDPRVISSVNGQDAVTLKVKKTPEGNALDIMAGVQAVLADLRPALEREGVAAVATQDSTTHIADAMSTLGWNMVLGIILVCAIIWHFMGARGAALTAVGIPFAFLTTMILMYLTGNSLNEITLFSFVLVSGIIVDDAIVVVENIYRHVQQGRPLDEAIVDGTSEVMIPVVSATATTVAAFLPMLIMTGSTGEFFALIPKAVSFALAASLFECIFILPLHYKDWGPRPRPGAAADADTALLRALRRATVRLMRVTMRWRAASLGVVLAAFVAAMAVFGLSVSGTVPLIPIQFFPDDYSLYYAFIEGPGTTSIEATSARVRAMSAAIMDEGPGMARSAAGYAGFTVTEDYEQVYGANLGTVMVTLPGKEDRAFQDPMTHLERMRDMLVRRFGQDGFTVTVRPEKDGPPSGKDVTVRVVGTNEASIAALAQVVTDALRGPRLGPHLDQLDDDQGRNARVYRLAVDRARASEHGVDADQAARMAASVLDGRYTGKFRLHDEEVDLKLRLDPDALKRPEDALSVPVLEHPSGPVRLGDIVRPVAVSEPRELKRHKLQRARTITANIRPGAPLSAAGVARHIADIHEARRTEFPGAALDFGGEFEDTRRSYTSLTYAFAIAVLLIYLILATQFRSYAQPLIVLSAVVFALTGVIFGKLLTQSLFTVNSFIAVVGVTGVVVNDSLVLIDFINRAYRRGLSRRQAVEEGIRVRLRPILLTTLTTTLGLLPMALGIPSYSLVWGTMASTFVTGLATATFLTLFIVPVEWDLLTQFQEWRARREGNPPAPAAPETQPPHPGDG
jgi:HAE1 family hydrophobic/amphiphilic exporter-1